jgi:hypothetical protein
LAFFKDDAETKGWGSAIIKGESMLELIVATETTANLEFAAIPVRGRGDGNEKGLVLKRP